jgi:hypothetical protein
MLRCGALFALIEPVSEERKRIMKKICVIVVTVLSIVSICASTQAVNVPRVVVDVVAEKEFFANFKLHPDHSLCDVSRIGDALIGVVLLCPVGIQTIYVFEREVGSDNIFYEKTWIPSKRVREKKRRESILVSDAVKIARAAVERAEK